MRTTACLCAVLLLLIHLPAHGVTGIAPLPVSEADGVLVKFRDGTSRRIRGRSLRAAGCRNVRNLPLVRGLSFARLTAGTNSRRSIELLRRDPNVEFVEPNILFSIEQIPDDPRFTSLWGLNNRGQTGGSIDADIDAPEAWDLQTGLDVVVAVIDTGVDYNHPDLADNIWRNNMEIAGNNRDDDGNGYVDDVRGWDFFNNDNNPMDDHSHGTHVAGTIGARGNNGNGVAGINWSIRIMPLKFMNSSGIGSLAGAINAINYAVANGARVINASWGGGGFSTALSRTIQSAHRAGVLFVAAAGNRAANTDRTPHYPSGYSIENIVAVAATDHTDRLASFSNYGATTVDLGAPGRNILSTIRNGGYAAFSGTSMAAPHVSGVAALLWSSNPALTHLQVKALLMQQGEALTSLSGRTVSGARLNAFNAVAAAGPAQPPPPPAPTPSPPLLLTPGNASLNLGDTLQFNATGGQAPYFWQTSNSSIAVVDGNGLVSTLNAGSFFVSVIDSLGDSRNSGLITVIAPPPPLILTPGSATLTLGDTLQFVAGGGRPPYSWRSSNTAIAVISSGGLLDSLNIGEVFITVIDTGGNSRSSGPLTVQAPAPPAPAPTPAPIPQEPPAAFSVTPDRGQLAVGNILLLSASGAITAGGIEWTSSDRAIARPLRTSSYSAVLIGASPGTMTLTAVNNGNRVQLGPFTITP